MIEYRNKWDNKEEIVLIREDGQGYGHINLNEPSMPKDTAFIHDLVVHPNARSEGYGNEILDALEVVAMAEGKKYVVLAPSKMAVEWYRRHGYVPYAVSFLRKKVC